MAWPLMVRFVISPSLSVWQTLVNPALTAIISYIVLRSSALALWGGPGHVLSAFVAVILCLFGALPLYLFVSGLLGWDDRAMEEFSDAVDLVPYPFGALARLARYAAQSGAALSPLHGRFVGQLVREAAAEADALTAVKAELQ